MRSVATTVLTLVLFATYLGIGALAHDSHFSLGWVLGSTVLVWAGPAQIILISTLGSGATVVQAAIAVDRQRDPAVSDGGVGAADAAHARRPSAVISCWRRISSPSRCGSSATGCCRRCRASGASPSRTGSAAACSRSAWSRPRSAIGLAANLPQLFAAAILLLTPLAFLLSTARNCRQISDVLALVLGLALYPLVVDAAHRRRYPDQRHLGRHHRLWRALVAGARER